MTGFVSLVGAGPGDPELLTRRAERVLAQADLVLYDALVGRAVLDLAPHARRFSVGKRAGRKSVAQETTIRLMIRAAQRGQRVVRLKGGDPFVFGRGGEEALALAVAGVGFEVVPGISSALAAPALAGIPVTHRGVASAFVVVSGHAAEAFAPVLTSLVPGAATVVVLMGLGSRAALAGLLLEQGWPASTPAAILLAASTASAAGWRGRLADLGVAPLPDADAPGTIVVGGVVALSGFIGRSSAVDASGDVGGFELEASPSILSRAKYLLSSSSGGLRPPTPPTSFGSRGSRGSSTVTSVASSVAGAAGPRAAVVRVEARR